MRDTKLQAAYRDYPMRGEMCRDCIMFRPPDGCTAVQGDVRSSGWCAHFARGHERDANRNP